MDESRKKPDESCSELGRISAIIRHSPPEAEINAVPQATFRVADRQTASDEQLIDLWVHGRSKHTQRAYRIDALQLMAWTGKPLHVTTLADLQSYADRVESLGFAPATRHRKLSAVKSLFAFAHRIGYLPFDTGKPLRLRGFRDELSERILDESQVQRMIALEPHARNRTILMLLYGAGLRVSEMCGLRWKHLQARGRSGQVTVFGKRNKTRTILLPESVWTALAALREGASDDAPVFLSRRRGRGLGAAQVTRIVRKAANRACIPKQVTSHWLRHAHASHALDHRAPIHLVQQTLGHASVATTGRYLHARPTESSSNYLTL